MSNRTHIIIGGDAAGMSAASKIKRMRPGDNVIVLEKGRYISFASCGIPYFISGVINDVKDLIVLTPETAREKRGLDVRIRHEAVRIDPVKKYVSVLNHENGKMSELKYDRLLIATGALPFIPGIDGTDLAGVFTLRGIDQGIAIREFALRENVNDIVIIGAGYIGLEMAEAFRHLGKKVTIVEKLPQPMATLLPELAETVKEELHRQGVSLMLSTEVKGIRGESGKVKEVIADSTVIPADLVLLAIGVRPNVELARDAGIKLGKFGGISINERMQTSAPNIYSAGDCVEHRHMVTGKPVYIPLAPGANKEGRIAGENMAGKVTKFQGILGTAVAKAFDLEIAITGLNPGEAQNAGYEPATAVITAGSRAHYYPGSEPMQVALIYDKPSGRVLGGQIVGKDGVSKRIDIIGMAVAAKMTVKQLAQTDLAYAPPFSPVYDPINIAAGRAR